MARSSTVRVTWSQPALNSVNRKTLQGLFRLAFDIAAQARRNAPHVSGALRDTIRVQDTSSNTLDVIAGGQFGTRKVPYAWVREEGPNRNKATEHYMENAQRAIMTGDYMKKYFGDVTR